MEREAENEFKRVWRKLDQTEKDSRELIRVSEAVKVLAKKVDRFSGAVTLLSITIAGDLLSHYVK